MPNRLTDRPSTCRVSASGATANYTYDPNGNLLSKVDGADTWTYTWNAENELTKVQKSGAEVARFAYDPLGRRVEKVAGGVTTTYAYDGAGILREIRDGSALKYVHGLAIDEMLAVDDGTLGYFHQDALGSVLKMTNVAGVVTLTRQYDAWGNLEAGAGSPGFAFTGREWDSETGLHYYRARYYDPKIGRFISEDPTGFAAGPNFFAYVGNRPTTLIDPLGLDWIYSQSTGNLYHQTAGGLTYVATGYAGTGQGYNNPAMEGVGFVGPLPAGTYNIGAPLYPPATNTGNYSLPLDAVTTAQLLGRDNDFRIHGDNACQCQSASSGCIVLPLNYRQQIWNSNDHVLQVMHTDPMMPTSPPMPGPIGRFVNWLTSLFGGR